MEDGERKLDETVVANTVGVVLVTGGTDATLLVGTETGIEGPMGSSSTRAILVVLVQLGNSNLNLGYTDNVLWRKWLESNVLSEKRQLVCADRGISTHMRLGASWETNCLALWSTNSSTSILTERARGDKSQRLEGYLVEEGDGEERREDVFQWMGGAGC